MKEVEQRVVIVGGGAGGAELAAALGRQSQKLKMRVSLVDCASQHLWKPRLHEVAAGVLGDSEDAIPYLALGQANGFRFYLGALAGLDVSAKTIAIGPVLTAQGDTLLSDRVLKYDTLVLAFGSEVNDFGTPGVREYCHVLDDGERALAFQKRLLEEAVKNSEGSSNRLRIGIVGAGATGVELAAELHRAVAAMHQVGGAAARRQARCYPDRYGALRSCRQRTCRIFLCIICDAETGRQASAERRSDTGDTEWIRVEVWRDCALRSESVGFRYYRASFGSQAQPRAGSLSSHRL
jgi:hypothetical protein